MNFKQLSRSTVTKIYGLMALFILLGLVWLGVSFLNHPKYSGWLTGITQYKKENWLVAYNPTTNQTRHIQPLKGVIMDDFGAVSPDGRYIAYTEWNQKGTIRCLVVHKINTDSYQRFFDKDLSDTQSDTQTIYKHEVLYPSWSPDSRHIFFVGRNASETPGFINDNQTIYKLDVKTYKTQEIVKGGNWQGRVWAGYSDNRKDPWEFKTSPEQLTRLIEKYGGKGLSNYEYSSKLWVEFSAPCISPDGQTIVYSATLFRNSCPIEEGQYVWLASSIWVADINGMNPKLIYKNSDPASALGKVVWSSDGKNLVFYSYTSLNGGAGGIYSLDIKSNRVKTLVPVTKEHYTNIYLISMPNNEVSFMSVGSDPNSKEGRYIVNINNGRIREQKIDLENNLLWHFTFLF